MAHRSDKPPSPANGHPPKTGRTGRKEPVPDVALEDLFRGFVDHRQAPDYMERPELLSSYRSYYHPLTSAKGNQLGKEALAWCGSLFRRNGENRRALRIMDWGTGTGGFVEGVLQAFLPSIPDDRFLEVRLLDRSRSALAIAEETVRKLLPGRGEVRSEILCLPRIPHMDDRFDVLLQANVLAEQTGNTGGFVDALESGFDHLSEGGLLLLAEPADRISSRKLLETRDALLGRLSGKIQILAPCPNKKNAPCPALRDERDWCHEDRPFAFPPEILLQARSMGHIRDSLKMTYLIAQKSVEDSVPQDSGDSPSLRLVSEIRKERGMVWGIFCDGEERHRIRLLLRHKNEKNRFFPELSRGEEIRIGPLEKLARRGPFLDLSPEDRIDRFL